MQGAAATRVQEFMQLFVDNLTNIDFSYLDSHSGLLGGTWLAHAVLGGRLDNQGMVCDFGIVKSNLREWLNREIDHRLAVPVRAANLSLEESAQSISLTWRFGLHRQLHCLCPRQAIALVDSEQITADSVSAWSIEQLRNRFPDTVAKLDLRFTEETIPGPSYRYSHGLKKHAGNCQRIAHGHRSRIEIWENGEPAPELELQWAQSWQDIYIGSREDLIGEVEKEHVACYHFAYSAQQGAFELIIPKQCCYLIDTDSTVELIASHIADTLKQQQPTSSFRVKAFEGIGKGAIAER